MNFLDPNTLVDRTVYQLNSRNLLVGVWDANIQGFMGIRRKFNATYLFAEYEYDLQHGTARAIQALPHVVPANIALTSFLGQFDNETGREVAMGDPDERPVKFFYVDDQTEVANSRTVFYKNNDELFDLLLEIEKPFYENSQSEEEAWQIEFAAMQKKWAEEDAASAT